MFSGSGDPLLSTCEILRQRSTSGLVGRDLKEKVGSGLGAPALPSYGSRGCRENGQADGLATLPAGGGSRGEAVALTTPIYGGAGGTARRT